MTSADVAEPVVPDDWEHLWSSTVTVYRTPRGIVRVLGVADRLDHALDTARRATLLAAAGVPTPLPLDPPTVGNDHGVVGIGWTDLGPGAPIDWRSFGEATRLLHEVGAVALRSERLHDAEDVGLLEQTLNRHWRIGWATRAEYATLAPHLDRMAADIERIGSRDETVVVHDDLWSKNVVMADGRAWLVDLDNLCLGSRAYDLAFVARGLAAGTVEYHAAADFAAGYGSELPDVATAAALGRIHRFRWMLTLLRRRAHGEAIADWVEREIAAWGQPGGPD